MHCGLAACPKWPSVPDRTFGWKRQSNTRKALRAAPLPPSCRQTRLWRDPQECLPGQSHRGL